MQLELTIIDAFTDTVFKGNSAGVIMLEDWLDDTLMQSIAMQNNLSETAYLVKQVPDLKNAAGPTYHIRWFSPLKEMDFCGHATLASAFNVFTEYPTVSCVNFHADAVGSLTIKKSEDGKIMMDFPNNKPECIYSKNVAKTVSMSDALPDTLINGLSVVPSKVYKNSQAYFVIYENEEDVLNIQTDKSLLAKLAPLGVCVTCIAQSEQYKQYDFISRYFSQAIGGNEDPVTGSVHTALAPLWAERERLGKDKLIAYQASSRGGELTCEVLGNRVLISGYEVQYLKGVIEV